MFNLHPPSMPSLSANPSPSNSPDDLHTKLQAGTPHSSKTETLTAVVRAFSASKTLHQVLDLREPEPSVAPPAMPSDLTARFEAGLDECRRLGNGVVIAQRRMEDLTDFPPSQQGRMNLANIIEEMDSPVRAATKNFPTSGTDEKSRTSVPRWTSDRQAVTVAQQYTFIDSDSDAANVTSSERTDFKLFEKDHSSWKYGSDSTLADSECSRQGSTAGDKQTAASFLPRKSSLLSSKRTHINSEAGSNLHHATNERPPPGLRSTSTKFSVLGTRQNLDKKIYNYAQSKLSSLRRMGSLSLLFPSPGIDQQPQDIKQPVKRHTDSIAGSQNVVDDANLYPTDGNVPSPAPQITTQASSPLTAQRSRKRALSPSNLNEPEPLTSQRVCREAVAGLPVILYEEAAWKADLAGNTNALLTILVTWSHAMWSFYNQLPDPRLFSTHPAFPYPLTPPLNKQLLSVSFYDISIDPHKEVRFLGPGDVAEMSYHEVDVFSDAASNNNQTSFQCSSPVCAINRTLGLSSSEAPRHIHRKSKLQRAKTGEGRWCYVLIKGNRPEDSGTSPHVILAWHASAVTSTSDCLHTIYPNNDSLGSILPSQSKPKRFSSLQNFGPALRSSTKPTFHQTLRSASSSSELPAHGAADTEKQGGATLHRTVLKLEKAGCIPLIEGYRVEVSAFKDWMAACERGTGKVMMWRERERERERERVCVCRGLECAVCIRRRTRSQLAK